MQSFYWLARAVHVQPILVLRKFFEVAHWGKLYFTTLNLDDNFPNPFFRRHELKILCIIWFFKCSDIVLVVIIIFALVNIFLSIVVVVVIKYLVWRVNFNGQCLLCANTHRPNTLKVVWSVFLQCVKHTVCNRFFPISMLASVVMTISVLDWIIIVMLLVVLLVVTMPEKMLRWVDGICQLTPVRYWFGSCDIKECAFAITGACWICWSSAFIVPTFKLSKMVPAKSDGSWETAPMFLGRNFKLRSLMLCLSMKISPGEVHSSLLLIFL